MSAESSEATVMKRPRRYKKRAHFSKYPRPAVPVKGLWEVASEEEKATAHKRCVAMLEYWLGRKSREEVSVELGVSGVRLWQLSQSAVSGMLAGLLVQPRRRGRAIMRQALERPQDDVASLKKENAELKRKLQIAESAIRILRDLPGHRDKPGAQTPSETTAPSPGRRGEKRKRAGLQSRAAGSRDGAAGDAVPG